jgi:hypothetical protein
MTPEQLSEAARKAWVTRREKQKAMESTGK